MRIRDAVVACIVAALVAAAAAGPAAAAPPANDAFADRLELTGPSPTAEGATADGTSEPGEPDLGPRSAWWSWTAPADGEAWIDTCGSSPDTTFAVFTGSVLSQLDVLARGSWECDGAAFPVLAGVSYPIAVYGNGPVRLRLNPAPDNDDFAAGHSLDPLGSGAGVLGSTTRATTEPGEPAHAGSAGSGSVWYRFTAARTGLVSATACPWGGPSDDTVLGVYTGPSVDALTEVASNDDSPLCFGDGGSAVTFPVTAGQEYLLAVGAKDGASIEFDLSVTPPPPNDAFADAEPFDGFAWGELDQAGSEPGEPAHAGAAAARSLWYRWTATADGPAEVELCAYGDFAPRLAVYTGTQLASLTEVVRGQDGGCRGSDGGVVARIDAVAGTEYLLAVDGDGGGYFDLTLSGGPANDDLAGALELGEGGRFGRNILAGKEAGEPDHAGDPGGGSLWYRWTAPGTGEFVLETCGELDTLLAVYTGEDVAGLTPVASNDDAGSCGRATSSRVTFDATAGETYFIAVDGKGGARGEFTVYFQARPYNDSVEDPDPIGPGFQSGSTLLATKEAGEPDHSGNAGGHSVWFRWWPSEDAEVTVSTCEADFDTLLAVYRRDGDATDFAAMSEVARSDDAPGCGPASTGSRVRFQVEADGEYLIAVDGKNGESGTFDIELRVAPPNDRFDGASAVTTATPGGISAFGDNRAGSEEGGEPDHAGDPGGRSLWYRWTAPASGRYAVDTCRNGSLDTLLAVYEGDAVGALTEVAASDDSSLCGPESRASGLTFDATGGQTYRIAVDGKAGAAGFFQLRIGARPANDDVSQASPVTARLLVSGTTRAATREAGEPTHAGDGGGGSVWYRWTAPRTGPVMARTCDAFFAAELDTLVAVYTGSSIATLAPVVANDDTPGCGDGRGSVAAWTATAGTEYRIAVDGKAGQTGDFSLTLVDRPANDDLENAQAIVPEQSSFLLADNRGGSKQPGEPDHAGDPGGHSIWYRFTAQRSGTYSLTHCNPSALVGVYTGTGVAALSPVGTRAGHDCGGGTGERLSFAATAGADYLIGLDGRGGFEGTLQLTIGVPPAGDGLADAIAIAGVSGSVRGSNASAGKEAGEPDHAGDAGGRSVWHRWVAPGSGTATVDLCETGFDTLLGVYRGESMASLVPVAQSDDSPDCRPQTGSRVSFPVTGGAEYLIAVDGKAGASGQYKLAVNPPGNDRFSRATEISGSGDTASGTTRAATREPLEPVHGDFGGSGGSVWYRWTAHEDGPASAEVCIDQGSDQDLAVYGGAALGELWEHGAPEQPRSCSFGRRIAFEAVAGETYRIAVGARFDGAEASFRLLLNGSTNDAFGSARTLRGATALDSGSTLGASKQAGEPNHAGDLGGHSVWYRWRAPSGAPGDVTVATCGSGFDSLVAVYAGAELSGLDPVAASDDAAECGPGSDDGSVTFRYEPGTEYRIAVDGRAGAAGDYTLRLDAVVPPPPNDAFGAPRVLDGEAGTFAGSTISATREPGEPAHGAGGSVWYRWTAAAGGPATLDTCGSDFDTVVGVYTGSSLGSLATVATGDDSGSCGAGSQQSRLEFTAIGGEVYLIAVAAKADPGGELVLRLNRPANDDFADALEIATPFATVSGTTLGASAEPDEPAHGGEPAGSSVWYRWTAPQSGQVHLHTCTDLGFPASVHVYTGTELAGLGAVGTPVFEAACAASDLEPPVPSSAVRFTAVAGVTYRVAVDAPREAFGFGRGPARPFVLQLNAPSNDLEAAATPLIGTTPELSGSNDGASRERGEEDRLGPGGGASVWYRWYAPGSGPATIDTCGSGFDTRLAVFGPDRAPVASNDDSDDCAPGSTRSSAVIEAVAGQTYLVAVDGKGGATGAVDLRVSGAPDVTPPETVGSLPAGPLASSTYSWSATSSEPGSSFECSVDGAPFAPCVVDSSHEERAFGRIQGLAEGAHRFAVRAVDPAGHVDGTPSSADFNVDLSAPETDITSGPDGPTNANPVRFEFESPEPAARFECSMDGAPRSACLSPKDYPGLSDGPHTLRVWAIDPAGNVDATPALGEFSVDRTPPTVEITGGPEGLGRDRTATFSFASPDPDASFECALDQEGFAPCGSPRSYADLPDGPHTFRVRAADPLGNLSAQATRGFTVDATPPRTTFADAPGEWTNDHTPAFSFAADEPASGFACAVDDGPLEPCASPVTIPALADGPHSFTVRATDLAGNDESPAARREFTVDTREPVTSIASGPEGITNRSGPFTFESDEEGAAFECAIGVGEFEPCSSPHTLAALGDGAITLRVRAVDRAGNADASPAVRDFTLDTRPPVVEIVQGPGAVSGPDVTVAFQADEAPVEAECRLDAGELVPCSSPVGYEDLPDGPHSVEVRARDQAGNVSPSATVDFVVDTAPPDTEIVSGPADHTRETSVELSFRGSDADRFECSLDGATFSDCSSPAGYSGLADGAHSFRVRAVDAAGQPDPTPAERDFTVDTRAPETEIREGPTGPVHDEGLSFAWSSDEATGSFECAFDGTQFGDCPEGFPEGLGAGNHVFRVRAIDAAGNVDPTPAEYPFTIVNEAPVAELELDRDGGPAPLAVEAAIGGQDLDGDPLRYELQFGDGAASQGVLPDGPVAHTYTEPGVYMVRLELDDGFDSTVVTRTITVTPPEPLEARAGDDQIVVAGEPVILDGADSRPLHGIGAYEWDLGDGTSADGAVVEHAFETPGDYEARLTVSGPGGPATDSAAIQVLPRPEGEGVRVTVRSGGAPLQGADVLVLLPEGRRISAITGGDGVARLYGLPDGEHTVLAYKTGYLPNRGTATAADGAGEGTVDLAQGPVATAEVDSRRMTLQEILDAGIDPNDPDNQWTYEFEVELNLTPPPDDAGGGGGGGTGGFGGHLSRGGFLPGTCTGPDRFTCVTRIGGATVLTRMHWVEEADAPILSSLVIPFRATWLKEFYEVSLIVNNLASPGFDLERGNATLALPPGLALAPTREPQALTSAVPDIPGGQSAAARWILRGDAEGEYHLAASYAGSLEPFGRTVRLEGRTDEPIKVWGASALELEVSVDEVVQDRYPFTAFVKLRNVADMPVYNPAVELLRAGRVGYIEQPRQQRRFATSELAPGATFTAGPFVLVPEPTGEIDLSRSFIRKTAGNADLGGTIVTHEREPSVDGTPRLSGQFRNDTEVVLEWDPVAGAEGYEVYTTPDRSTDFPDEDLEPTEWLGEAKAVVQVPAGRSPYFAVATVDDGRRRMWHPLLSGADAGGECEDGPRRAGDANCDGVVRVAILGDSFISGEGAAGEGHPYRPGTDTVPVLDPDGKNLCHRSERSWAVRLAKGLVPQAPVDFWPAGQPTSPEDDDVIAFLACSGAVTDAVDGTRTRATKPGALVHQYHTERVPQLDRLDELGGDSFDVVLLSIGGNDAGFGSIVETCLMTKCLSLGGWRETTLDRLDTLRYRVAHVARAVRRTAPNAEVYRINYPDPLRPLPNDCGSLGADGVAELFDKLTNPVGHFADGGHKIDAQERRWFSEVLIPRLNGSFDAASRLAGVHVIDVEDAFRDHAICSPDPYSHGLKAGNDKPGLLGLGLLGNESFHPTPAGQDAMLEAALGQHPLSRFGKNRNPAAIELEPAEDIPYLSIAVVGNDPQTEVFTSSSGGHVVIHDALPNTAIAVSTFSLGTVGGRGVTDAEGDAEIPFRIGPSTAPGLHHLEVWTEDGERLGSAGYLVGVDPKCNKTPDIDGDALGDPCDLVPDDGPLADADGDGIHNIDDACPLEPNGPADADQDGEPDACDPDAGADLFATSLRGPLFPDAIGPPTAPRDVVASAGGPGEVDVSWTPPAGDGGDPVTGYTVGLVGGGNVQQVGSAARSLRLTGLPAGGPAQVILRARNAAGLGAVALSDEFTVAAPPVPQDPGPGGGDGGGDNGGDGAGPGPRPGSPAGDDGSEPAPPTLSGLRVRRFTLTGLLVNGPAQVRVLVERLTKIKGRACSKRRRAGKRCQAWKRSGRVRSQSVTGAIRVPLGKLRPGSYRLKVTATRADGQVSEGSALRLRVRQAKRRR